MNNDRQVTLTKCDYCGKYYEACNIHKCKKQPQQDKYIPCTHCTVQKCKECDYELHKKAVGIIQVHKNHLKDLRDYFKNSFIDNDSAEADGEMLLDVVNALELVE